MATPAALAQVQPGRVRLIALNYRKPGLSQSEFDKYWQNEHATVFSDMQVAKDNLLKYEQWHRNAQQAESLKQAGFSIPNFDGVAVFEAESWEKILAVFTSEEYRTQAVPDEERFLDRGRTTCFPANLVTVIGD